MSLLMQTALGYFIMIVSLTHTHTTHLKDCLIANYFAEIIIIIIITVVIRY